MSVMGRKLLPMESPQGPLDRFAWLVRAIRSFSVDPTIRSTRSFSAMLSRAAGEQLLPETVNKLENGKLNFTVERCLAYEAALGLNRCDLVDPYVWLCRENGTSPRFSTAANEASPDDIDLIVRVAQEVPLQPLEWIRLARVYSQRKDLFTSPRVRDSVLHGVLRDYGRTYEREQRLMREALIIIGDEIVDHLAYYLNESPMQYFNAIEIFGYIPQEITDDTLKLMQSMLGDRLVAPSILEAVARNRKLLGPRSGEIRNRYHGFEQFALDLLVEPGELYLPREAALTLLRYSGPVRVTTGRQRQLSNVRDDLRQLSVAPFINARQEYVKVAVKAFHAALTVTRENEDLPVDVPGIQEVIKVGMFDEDRLSRLGSGSLLTAWQHADHVIDGLAEVMLNMPKEDYGTQRSIVRLVTKIGGARAIHQLQRLAWTPLSDSGTRLSIAWALGSSGHASDHAGDRAMRHLWEIATSRSEKRVIVASARRRRDISLLIDMQATADPQIRAEVVRALRSLG